MLRLNTDHHSVSVLRSVVSSFSTNSSMLLSNNKINILHYHNGKLNMELYECKQLIMILHVFENNL